MMTIYNPYASETALRGDFGALCAQGLCGQLGTKVKTGSCCDDCSCIGCPDCYYAPRARMFSRRGLRDAALPSETPRIGLAIIAAALAFAGVVGYAHWKKR